MVCNCTFSRIIWLIYGLIITAICGNVLADLNVLESITKGQYTFPKKRPFAGKVLLSLCDHDTHHPRHVIFFRQKSSDDHPKLLKVNGYFIGASMSEDVTAQVLLLDFLIVVDMTRTNDNSTHKSILSDLDFEVTFQTSLYVDHNQKLETSSHCEAVDKQWVDGRLQSLAISCVFPITNVLKTVTTLWKSQDKNLVLPVEFLLEESSWGLVEWFPLCKRNAHTVLSDHLLKGQEEMHKDTGFYHTLVGCTKPLANMDQLERQWPGIIRQWVMHHVYLMGLGYVSVYDVDGSAWEYVKEYVGLGLVRYYGSFTFSQFGSSSVLSTELVDDTNNGTINIAIKDPAHNFLVNSHCIWDSKGKTEWLFILPSPAYFLNDFNIGGKNLFFFLDEHDLNEAFTKLEVVQHDIRVLDIALNRETTIPSVFSVFPYVHLEVYPAKFRLIIDPHKIASLLDGDLFDGGRISQYGGLQLFIREYSSITMNNTIQPNTIGTTESLVVDNTMEKLAGFFPMAEELHNFLIKKSNDVKTQQRKILEEALIEHEEIIPREMMNLLIIAPGLLQIPPVGYGAVEIIIWNYYQELHTHDMNVTIINTSEADYILQFAENLQPDIIHIHLETLAYLSQELSKLTKLVIVTIHGPNFANPSRWGEKQPMYFNAVSIACRSKPNVYFFVINSKHIDLLTIRWNIPRERIYLIPNGVEVESYKFSPQPSKRNKSISVGKVEKRKGQYFLQANVPEDEIVFVGPSGNCTQFNFSLSSYLGEWTKEELYENLTHFGNLVHLATDEAAAPLVVLEALAAGLGIVTTVNASANLDVTKPFITVIPDEKMFDKDYVLSAIRANRELSLTMREEIREYARQTFSWKEVIVPKYVSTVKDVLKKLEAKTFPYNWALKYNRIKQMTFGVTSKSPYIAVMSIFDYLSNQVTVWIDSLRMIGVEFFLFYLVRNDYDNLHILSNYIEQGIVEIQYISDFAYVQSLDDKGKENIFGDKYFYILLNNEAVAYFQILHVTWMSILFEQDYIHEKFPNSCMIRNSLKFYLKQQERRQVDIMVLHGIAVAKYARNVSISEDNEFIERSASRSFSQVQSSVFHSQFGVNCIIGDYCTIETIGINNNSPFRLTSFDIDYSWNLQKRGMILSAQDEVESVLKQASITYIEVAFLQHVTSSVLERKEISVVRSNSMIMAENEDVFDHLMLFATVYRDINRANWQSYQRTNDTYFEYFLRMAKLIEYPLIVYTDNTTAQYLQTVSGGLPTHIIFQDITSVESAYERHVELHKEIIASEVYQSKVPLSRKDKPEHNNGEYTVIMASKMDYVKDAHSRYPGYSYYAFIDFGYSRRDSQVPKNINPSKLLPNKVMFAMMSLPDRTKVLQRDELLATDETFPQGSSFIIPNMLVPSFYRIWTAELDRYHADYIVDDDQAMVYRMMIGHPEAFVYVRPFKWHALYSTYLNEILVMYV